MANDTITVLRMDDVGAATKQYEQYAKLNVFIAGKRVPTPPFLNWGALKRVRWWKGWGPYPELTVGQWEEIFEILRKRKAKLTVGLTASWVERDGSLTPFDKKFPGQAALLREGAREGLVEIANHGLTHCVLEGKKFLPHPFRSNRRYHREFWEWLPDEWHKQHIFRSQEILQRLFSTDIVTLIPSGNYWTEVTEEYAVEAGIKYISAVDNRIPKNSTGRIRYVPEDKSSCFHDREIVLTGSEWLNILLEQEKCVYGTVRDYFLA
jgi:peptidoglycan/xylan/chitin deacetylase (PgdA/CDA1 family)